MSLLGSLFKSSKRTDAGARRGTDARAKTVGESAELLSARASTLVSGGRFAEAHDNFLRAEAGGIRTGALYRDLGWSAFSTGKVEQAEIWMRKSVDAQPDAWQSRFKLGVILQAQRKWSEAASCFSTALELRPGYADSLIGLAECALESGDLASAEAHIRKALTLDGERPAGWDRLGVIVGRQGRYRESLEAFERAVHLQSRGAEQLDCFANLATELTDAGRSGEAIELCERALPNQPSVNGHYAYALALLTAGRLADGWPQYEFRFLRPAALSRRQKSSRPMWSGQELKGKTILLRSEQGYGDVIQFLRYAPRLKALGATVLFEAFAGFEGLARRCRGIDAVLQDGPMPHYDFYSYLMSLPRIFGTDLETIPCDVPYLNTDPARVEFWASKLGDSPLLKVGLVWSGSPEHPKDRYRSIPLRTLSPLWDVKGVQFFSLQKGTPDDELPSLRPGITVQNLGAGLADFSDAAALISQLDLIICVDTAMVHLAGALGREVWTLIPKPSDWRWMEDREDSPWYPTMRLFRQHQRGEWGDVIERVKVALTERASEDPKATQSRIPPSTERDLSINLPVPDSVAGKSGAPLHLSAVVETRYGIVQYFPGDGTQGASLASYGEHLQLQLDLLAKIVRPGAIVVEVGAGVGTGALFLAAAIGSGGHLFLYEPRPVVQRLLRQNLTANSVTNITVMKRALGSSPDRNSSATEPVQREPAPSSAMVEMSETADELQLKRLDWLKINEGAATLEILTGAADTLWRLRPSLFVAATESELARIRDRLREFSYRCFEVATPLFNPENFNQRAGDVFGGRMALAVLAVPEEVEIDIALEGCRELS